MDPLFSLTSVAAAINFFTLLCAIFFFYYRKFRSETKKLEENRTVASSSLVPSSLPHNWKHHVFPSFHGADVRRSFLSHILKEFRSKAIDLFIDNNIDRGKSIGPELVEAIRGSRIAIVLLSQNYPSSTWCLDELLEIIKCRDVLGQTVMVLFYEVDPTDVKKQTGEFGKVFRKTCRGKTDDVISRWKWALAEVAKIAGYHSKNWDNDADMIEEIAIDVSNKLNISTPSSDFDTLVGMGSHMRTMDPLLRLDLDEARMIGILGMPGIGKTTIAKFLFHQHSKDFQLCVFLENIKERYPIPACSDVNSVKLYLQEQFLSQLINQVGIKITHLGTAKDRLKDKRVLVVLDNVDQIEQLEAMGNETSWFGPRSRIIITTQDENLLRRSGVNHVYRMDLPSSSEAFQIFCMYAFDQKSAKDGFRELALEVTELACKLPLGLRIMGSYFRRMSEQDWEKELPRLRTRLDGKIESILKFSYDALCDEDKSLFLHIACFFNNERVDIVEGCLANSVSVPSVTHGLHVLADKSLISLDDGYIQMHNLLLRLGKEIMRKQYVSEPRKPRFLDDTRDIDTILCIDDKTNSSSVIGMDLQFAYDTEDMDYEKELGHHERVFQRFSCLHFLRVKGHGANVYFLQSWNSLPSNLRFLTWFNMPCLPPGFKTKFLVKLDMQFSKLEKLWQGIQPLGNLRVVDLTNSRRLKEVPDLSTAINLCDLNLSGCSSLVELPFSVGKAINLQKLNLKDCSSMAKLPSSIGNLINLQDLNFFGCSSLVELPSSIGNSINLHKIDLSLCSSLVKLPASIGNLINLQNLNLFFCSSLVELPSSIGNAINLIQELDLRHCSSLKRFALSVENLSRLQRMDFSFCSSVVEISSSIGNAIFLQKLDLWGCSRLVELPFSIGNLINLRKLCLWYCSSLLELPSSIGNAVNLEILNIGGCSSLVDLPSSMKNLGRLSECTLWKCSKLKVVLTNINLESLEELNLSDCYSINCHPKTSTNIDKDLKLNGTAIKEMPSSVMWSCEMQELGPWIERVSVLRKIVLMKNLESLPQLPYSITKLDAEDCESLERLECSFLNPDIRLNFARCINLNQEARDLIIHTPTNEYAVLPGGEVPVCFTYRALGSYLTVKLNQTPPHTSTKFKACIIFTNKKGYLYGYQKTVKVNCSITSKQNALIVCRKTLESALLEHLYTFEVEAEEVTSTELLFAFEMIEATSAHKYWDIKECGIMELLDVPSSDDLYKRLRDGDEDSHTLRDKY